MPDATVEAFLDHGTVARSVDDGLADAKAVLAHIERDGILTEAAITSLGAGETVGELSLLDGEPRSASCVAVKATRLLVLTREQADMAIRIFDDALTEAEGQR